MKETPDVEKRVRMLLRSTRMPRRVADIEVRALGSDAIPALCRIAREERLRRRRTKVVWWAINILCLLAVTGGVGKLPDAIRDRWGVTACILWLLSTAGLLLVYFDYRSRAGAIVAQIEDPQGVGALLDSMGPEEECGGYDTPIMTALTRLLPRLHASDSEWLQARHLDVLHRALRACRGQACPARQAAYLIAALKALEQIGDETSIASVTLVAETVRHPGVRCAARACLPHLQERARSGERGLLRAAAIPDESLVRPVSGHPATTGSAVLLRPGPATPDP